MLSKSERLPRTALSTKPLQQVRFRYGVIKLVVGAGSAVVVSKKVAKTAPSRNRMRRRVYEVLRKVLPKKQTRGIVVYPTIEVLKVPFAELEQEINGALFSLKSQ